MVAFSNLYCVLICFLEVLFWTILNELTLLWYLLWNSESFYAEKSLKQAQRRLLCLLKLIWTQFAPLWRALIIPAFPTLRGSAKKGKIFIINVQSSFRSVWRGEQKRMAFINLLKWHCYSTERCTFNLFLSFFRIYICSSTFSHLSFWRVALLKFIINSLLTSHMKLVNKSAPQELLETWVWLFPFTWPWNSVGLVFPKIPSLARL